jgi:hypothetical protein
MIKKKDCNFDFYYGQFHSEATEHMTKNVNSLKGEKGLSQTEFV